MMPIPVPPLLEHLNTLPLDPPEPFCRPFSLAEILSVTHNFDESLVIGQGGFGKVYKGVIDNETSVVAVKRLNSTSKQGDSEFRTEIEMLAKFRHSHIVSLIGYCYSSIEMILVYEYMVNGSLADHLYKTGKYRGGPTLSWVQRLKICLGAARGLDYLHTGTGVQDSVIHRDVKSSNILLDKNCAAKVSDFGLSRISPTDQSCTHISTNVKGTTGYMDPEYLLTLRLTMKSDVYSFGVVLFEVLCGRRAVDLRLDDEQWSLARWAQHCIEKGTLHRLIDPNLRWEILPESYTEFARIANQCLCYQSKKRPTMTRVVASLDLALALQLGHKGSSAFEMELFCTSEAPENIEKVDSKMVQEIAIKFGSCDEDNKDIPRSHVKPTKRKALRKLLQLLMFRTVREASVAQLQDPPPVDARARERSGAKLRSGTSRKHIDRLEEFLFSDLAAATNNFSLENKIGVGSVGIVYKGKLLDGREVAIKRGEKASSILREKESSSAFDSELTSLSRLHHKNLVRLVGFCESGRDEERLLVYEYMKHRGLYHRLHDKNNVEKSSSPLNSWKMRIKISLDAARGIEYLHNYAVPPIIHRDIKSSNILLDANWTARVSDFGLSMVLMGRETNYSSIRAAGTVGYIDPDYYRLNKLTTASDVYSLGVVLLELLTGKRAIFKNGENGIPTTVVDFAVLAIIAGELPKILDPRVGSPLEKNETEAVKLVADTAMQCVDLKGRERPTMFDVVANLDRALALCDDI